MNAALEMPQLSLTFDCSRDTSLVGVSNNAGAKVRRRCECCSRLMPRKKYANAKTCGKRCRQTLSRRRLKVSKASRSKRGRPLLSVSARRRALEGVAID